MSISVSFVLLRCQEPCPETFLKMRRAAAYFLFEILTNSLPRKVHLKSVLDDNFFIFSCLKFYIKLFVPLGVRA